MEKTVHLIRWCSIYANAGLPNAFGGYDETPEIFSKNMLQSAKKFGKTNKIFSPLSQPRLSFVSASSELRLSLVSA